MLTKYLIKIFIGEHKLPVNYITREKYGKTAGFTGVISNTLLFTIKLIIGLASSSISIIADAVNNLTDSGSSIITLIGFKISAKPADAKHPYGHARMEYISGLLVSVVILFLGLQLSLSSIHKILDPKPTSYNTLTIIILIISIMIKLWQKTFYQKIGKIINSMTLTATAADSKNDILATFAVLISVLINKLTGLNLDGYMGILVSIFILFSGTKLIIETVHPLLGIAPTNELVKKINRKILSYDHIIGIHDLTIHNYGPMNRFASVHCEVPAEQDIMISHDIIDNIERDFLLNMDIHMVIHLDPVVTNDQRTNDLKDRVKEIVANISPELDMHDLRVVWGVSHSNLIFEVAMPYDFDLSEDELIAQISAEINKLDANYRMVITVEYKFTSK